MGAPCRAGLVLRAGAGARARADASKMQAQAVRVIAAREWCYCWSRLAAGVGLYSFRRQEHRKLLAAAVARRTERPQCKAGVRTILACTDIDVQGRMCSQDANLARIALSFDAAK